MRMIFKVLFLNALILMLFFNIGLSASTSYYVDATNGKDSNTGRSHAQAWKTLGKVNNTSFNTGDDVYLLCGSKFSKEMITVDWAGTETNNVVIGAYYIDGSVIIGVNADGKPIIDGENVYPQSDSGYIVGVANYKQYVTIQDLHVKRSKQFGIKLTSGAKYCTVQRCRVDETYLVNIYFAGGANNGTVEYCELSRGSKMRLDMIGDCRGWPPGGIRMVGTKNGIVQYNWIYNQYAEGINVGHQSTTKYNLVGDTTSVGIYVQSQHGAEVAYNLVYGTDTNTYNSYPSCSSAQTSWKGNGIVAGIEVGANYGDLYDVKIHHNIVINRGSGIRAYNSHATAKFRDLDINNNTLIDNQYSFGFSNNDDKIDGMVSLRYNLSYTKHNDSKHLIFSGPSLDNWIIDHNQWAIKTAPTGIWHGNGDVTVDPDFLKKRWKGAIDESSDFSAANMLPKVAVLNSGSGLGVAYSKFIGSSSNYNTAQKGDPICVYLSSESGTNTWLMGAIKNDSASVSCRLCPPKSVVASGINLIN